MTFTPPNFEKDPVRQILKKSWQAFDHRLSEVWKVVKEIQDGHEKRDSKFVTLTEKQNETNIEVAKISGSLKIIIYMGGGAIALLTALLVVILNKA